MKMVTRRGIILWILCFLFLFASAFLVFSYATHARSWGMSIYNRHIYSHGEIVGAGTVYDCDGVVLAETVDGERVYAKDKDTRKATLHMVGDNKRFRNSVQYIFGDRLTGYNVINGVYSLVKNGSGEDLHLTLDSEICKVAYDELEGRKGTVAVVNYKTGDIICCVSTPTYDINNPPDDLDTNVEDYEGVFINRFLGAHYVPGSTFKIVTAICAIENIPDVFERTWHCSGSFKPDAGGEIICNAEHGNIDFKTALAKSCNSVFAQIAIELGSEKLERTAKELGIGSPVSISGEMKSFAGEFGVKGTGEDLLGWTGIGQGKTRIAPATMLRIVSAIANGGSAASMNILHGSTLDKAGELLNIDIPKGTTKLMDADTADAIKDMLRNNVKKQYGDDSYPGLNLCAKSGTAQIDSVDEHNIAWFTGFMDDDSCPYAFVVAIEHGNSGSRTAGPVANRVMQAVAKKYR